MANPRRVPALIGCWLVLAVARAIASGEFYEEALPTLSAFLTLDRLPGKSFEQIHRETSPSPAGSDFVDIRAECEALPKKLLTTPAATLLPLLDEMLATARSARASNSAGLVNLLDDLRDLLATPDATAKESSAYVRWRIDHAEWFGFSWRDGSKVDADSSRERRKDFANRDADIEERQFAASPALFPQWLYLRGALGFKAGEDTESQKWFAHLVTGYPASPRAEAAQFMVARCQISRSRTYDYQKSLPGFGYTSDTALRGEAKSLLEQYLAKYLSGHFAGDALGWLGATAYDAQDYLTALGFYLRQTEVPRHPELLPAAAIMCEKVLAHLASTPDDRAFAEVARHPRLAEALVWLIVSSVDADHFNGEFDPPPTVRKWREEILPRVASAIAAQHNLYKSAEEQPRYLTILALAASGAGRQEDALKLIDESSPLPTKLSAESLFVRGVALQRGHHGREAVVVFRKFLKSFSSSPMRDDARLRLGLALADDHQAGLAITEFGRLAEEKRPELDYSDLQTEPSGLLPGDPGQARQFADALLNFAPLPELAAALKDDGLSDVEKLRLSEALACRYLAREQFDEAKKFVTPAQWELAAAALEKLNVAMKIAKGPVAKSTACLRLGDAWAAVRGRLLTYPLDSEAHRRRVFMDDAPRANLRREQNAAALSVTGNYQLEMENRDELRHAFDWWIAAADADTKSPAAAVALWRALRAMPAIADVSLFTIDRAARQDWSSVSRKLYERLRAEHPESVEAKRLAVYWDFPFPKAMDGELPERSTAGKAMPGTEVFTPDGGESQITDNRAYQFPRILALEANADEADPAALRGEVAALKIETEAVTRALSDQFIVNFLDDLSLFLQEPDPGSDVRRRYVAMRIECLRASAFGYYGADFKGRDYFGMPDHDERLRKDIAKALADAETKPVADFFEFLDAAVVANHFVSVPFTGAGKDGEPYTYRGRNYPLLAKTMQAFLEKYPQSKKREAALLLHARALFNASKPVVFKKPVSWPQAPRWEGGDEKLTQQPAPFEPRRIAAALDRYDREFPQGRYAAEIQNYRGALAFRERKWKFALDETLAQIDDGTKPDLHPDAANRLGEVFALLADKNVRAELLPVIKADTRACERLAQYLNHESDSHPLLYMKGWLREQLAKR